MTFAGAGEERPPAEASGISVVETHVSTLFFTGTRVYKLKKPVLTGFLDFRRPETRRAACEREVELNRRLSPDAYLGVADLVMDGVALDHFVVMQQLPAERRLSRLLGSPDIKELLEGVTKLLVRFHSRAERGPEIDQAAMAGAQRALWRTGVDQLEPFLGSVLVRDEVERMAQLAESYLDGRSLLFEHRIQQGRVVDGHGDLLAEDIFSMEDGPRILDCLEFDDRLRHGDVLADIAFLAMDIERLGRPDLAIWFLDRYRTLSEDTWPESLAHFYIAYRAHVRSKVACLRRDQGDADAASEARDLHALALDHLERGRVHLVLVGGAPGTGKTTLARGLAQRLGALRISSDDIRGEVVPPTAGPAGELHSGKYAPERVDDVYRAIVDRAQEQLSHGVPVVLDASWKRAAHRDLARELSRRCTVPITELRCSAPPDVTRTRIEARAARGEGTSEVTAEIAQRLAAERDHWPEAIVVDTTLDPSTSAERAADAVRSRLASR